MCGFMSFIKSGAFSAIASSDFKLASSLLFLCCCLFLVKHPPCGFLLFFVGGFFSPLSIYIDLSHKPNLLSWALGDSPVDSLSVYRFIFPYLDVS